MMGEMTNEQSLEMKKEKTISWEESRYSHSSSKTIRSGDSYRREWLRWLEQWL